MVTSNASGNTLRRTSELNGKWPSGALQQEAPGPRSESGDHSDPSRGEGADRETHARLPSLLDQGQKKTENVRGWYENWLFRLPTCHGAVRKI